MSMYNAFSGTIMRQYFSPLEFSHRIFDCYDMYKESTIDRKNFKHSSIEPLISELKRNRKFSVKKLGESVERRSIYLVSLGKGSRDVLLWSQMHGDESTATMALFDIFNFFSKDDDFSDVKEIILKNLRLNFLPMLNPDGAEKFQRRNALGIDINRDASRLQCPESRILKEIRDKLSPEFGFNLHDQSPRYSVGNSFKIASISFLAPRLNYGNEVPPVREKAMKLIVDLKNALSEFIPGHISKYSDDFEPRAFGDNIQSWGTSTILIESGGWQNDHQKQFLRKLNFTLLLTSLLSIAEESYTKNKVKDYYCIPENKENIFDLLIRNVILKQRDKFSKVDIGINRYEILTEDQGIVFRGIIEDMGDLSGYYGSEEYCFDSLEALSGKEYTEVIESYSDLKDLNFEDLLNEGITTINVKKDLPKDGFSKYPILIKSSEISAKIDNIAVKSPAFFLLRKGKEINFAVINGFLYNLKTSTNNVYNSCIVQ
ncbi:MAG: M14 family zinc carboxypeptidase [Bacteroidota bacterium]|nr:M14 family zinc carboxypeptidase [Bacteroidota bacterium]